MSQYHDIYVDGVKLPTPSSFKVSYEDMETDGIRPIITGILKRNRIRARVATYELSWLLRDLPDTKQIFDMLEPVTVSVEAYDYRTNTYVTKTMYCSSCEYEYIRTAEGMKAQALSASLVEV